MYLKMFIPGKAKGN